MTTITTQTEINGATYKIELEGQKVTIRVRHPGESAFLWAGDGIWQDGIHDCDARLGSDPDETEAVYQALEDELTTAIRIESEMDAWHAEGDAERARLARYRGILASLGFELNAPEDEPRILKIADLAEAGDRDGLVYTIAGGGTLEDAADTADSIIQAAHD